jgi:tetratricopeptide (TPR) repeat protein
MADASGRRTAPLQPASPTGDAQRARYPAPSNLPPPPTHLTGRRQESATLQGHLAGRSVRRPVVVISGEPGIGKTAFALHAAHEVASRFRGGELFARLHPTDPHTVEDVKRRLAAALSRSAVSNPGAVSWEEAQPLLRLGPSNRLLVVLDDVSSGDQVLALLPRTRWCAVIITTRAPLDNIRASLRQHLEPLDTSAGRSMLSAIIGAERIRDDPAAADAIVAAAACRPLAIRLVGMALANRQHIRLQVAFERMRPAGDRIGAASSVDNALDLSYAMLTRGEQRALSMIGLLDPGYGFAPWEIGALLGSSEREAWQLCDRLTDAGLLERHSRDATGLQEYRALERVELYARQLASTGLSFATRSERLTVLRRDRAERTRPSVADDERIFEQLHRIYDQGALSEAFKQTRDMVALCRDKQDLGAEMMATVMLAELHAELGGMEDVQDLLTAPLWEGGPSAARVRALRIKAKVHRRLRQLDEARAALEEARGLGTEAVGRPEEIRGLREAAIIESLGETQERGLELLDDAFALSADHPRQLAALCYARSRVLVSLGRPIDSLRVLRDGVATARQKGQGLWVAWLTYQRALSALEAQRGQDTIKWAERALEAFGEMRHRYGGAHCRMLMGQAAFGAGQSEKAAFWFEDALETFRYCGDTWVEAEAAERLARARAGCDPHQATELFQEAIRLYRSIRATDRVQATATELQRLSGEG